MRKLVVLTGAGISAESGIQTFRGSGGLWEGHRVEDVASPEAWYRDKELVLDFYNQRRDAVRSTEPNLGHIILADLENNFDITVITQNIDDLHERGGSSSIIHLHGEILKGRSSVDIDPAYVNLGEKNIYPGDLCPKGTQLRPHIVWFGEAVPMMEDAIKTAMEADIFLVVGTSLAVYPAAGLIQYTRAKEKYIVDPNIPAGVESLGFHAIKEGAGKGMEKFRNQILP